MSFKNVPQRQSTPASTVNALVRFAIGLTARALTLANKVHGIRPRLEHETKRERIMRRYGLATDRERRDAVQAAQRIVKGARVHDAT